MGQFCLSQKYQVVLQCHYLQLPNCCLHPLLHRPLTPVFLERFWNVLDPRPLLMLVRAWNLRSNGAFYWHFFIGWLTWEKIFCKIWILFLELSLDLQQSIRWAECTKESTNKKLNVLITKLENAKDVQNRINEIFKKSAYLTDEQISTEKIKTKNMLREPLKIIAGIAELEKNPDYLDEDQIQTLKSKTESLRKALKSEDQDNYHPDLECVICKSLPRSQHGNIHVYSCVQDHLLCQTCLDRVNNCPIWWVSLIFLKLRAGFLWPILNSHWKKIGVKQQFFYVMASGGLYFLIYINNSQS